MGETDMDENKYYSEHCFQDFRELIDHSAATFGKKGAFELKNADGSFSFVSYEELRTRFYRLCNIFLAAGLGGKPIAVSGSNCFSWVLSYLSASTVGIAVPIDKELHPDDFRDFLALADCAAVCADSKRLKGLEEVGGLPPLHYDFDEVFALTAEGDADSKRAWERAIRPDEMQVLLFTSGTTGSSKGVCLSQFNILSDICSTVRAVKITEDDKTLSILPLHHTYECTLNCLLLLSKGACICYCGGLTRIQKDMLLYSPSVLVVVPALLSMLSRRLKKTVMAEIPEKHKALFEENSFGTAMEKLPLILRRLVRGKVRKALGGKLRLFIVGAAALDTELVKDFEALGIRTLQGYGLTECAPLLAGNSDFYLNPDSTGIAMPGIEVKIDDPNEEGVGEIIAKGDNIMLGYYRDEEATRAVIVDGWFHTGDLGRMDEDGALYITGRLKNVIVTSNGKNIYPEELENRLSAHEEIAEVLVLPDHSAGEESIKAKILPNLEYISQRLGRLPSKEDIAEAIQNAIAEVNKLIPQYKHIKVVEILSNALEKTTTQKIKRFGQNTK